MTFAKYMLIIAAAVGATACGDLSADVERAKQGAVTIGQDALDAAIGTVDTQTACVLAGQSEAFCGCVAERLGPDVTREHVEALRAAVEASVAGQGVETAGEGGEPIDAATRQALVQCATRAAIDGAVGEAGN